MTNCKNHGNALEIMGLVTLPAPPARTPQEQHQAGLRELEHRALLAPESDRGCACSAKRHV